MSVPCSDHKDSIVAAEEHVASNGNIRVRLTNTGSSMLEMQYSSYWQHVDTNGPRWLNQYTEMPPGRTAEFTVGGNQAAKNVTWFALVARRADIYADGEPAKEWNSCGRSFRIAIYEHAFAHCSAIHAGNSCVTSRP
jgi:hypothetical protein